jgi:hypothetical protein
LLNRFGTNAPVVAAGVKKEESEKDRGGSDGGEA